MNLSLNSTNRHRLIDCAAYSSYIVGKKEMSARKSDTNQHQRMTLPQLDSIKENDFSNIGSHDTFDRRSTALLRQNRLKSLLDRDVVQ